MSRYKPIRPIAFTVSLAVLCALSCAARAFTITVSPPRLDLLVEPGQVLKGSIYVTGAFAEPVRITASIADWVLRPDGNPSFLSAGRKPRSLAGWLELDPTDFVLRQGQIQTVHYQMTVPPGVAGSYWGAVLFQNVPTNGSTRPMAGVVPLGRLATMVYATAKNGGCIEGILTMVSAALKPDGRLALSAVFVNRGNMLTRCSGRFELRDERLRKTMAVAPFGPLTTLPGGNRRIIVEFHGKLAPGKYTPFVRLDYGGRATLLGRGTPVEIAR